MHKFFCTVTTLMSLLSSIAVAADTRTQKILTAREVTQAIAKFENDQKVDCMAPKEHQIRWMCTNGPNCGFLLDVTCVKRIQADTSNDQIIRLSIAVQTQKQKVSFTPEKNSISKMNKFER